MGGDGWSTRYNHFHPAFCERSPHHVEPPTEKKQKKQNQDCLLRNPEKVDSFHKKLDEILHPVIEEFGITMQSSTSETWSSPPITDISLGAELNIQLESPPPEDVPTIETRKDSHIDLLDMPLL